MIFDGSIILYIRNYNCIHTYVQNTYVHTKLDHNQFCLRIIKQVQAANVMQMYIVS